jgi:hypothetical protein
LLPFFLENIMINFKSESANKTQQNNAKILFGKTGVKVLSKLEEYSKERLFHTVGIDALLNVLKTKDTALLEKFANSQTGKTLVEKCKKLANAKTFNSIIENAKSIKPLKSFDKFNTGGIGTTEPTQAARVVKRSTPEGASLAKLKIRGPSYMQHDLRLKALGRSFDMSDRETAHIVTNIERYGLGLTKTKDPLNTNSSNLYTLYGTKKSLEGFAKAVLGYHILELDSLKIKETKGVADPNEKPVDGYHVMEVLGKKLAAYFTKNEEAVDYDGKLIRPNTIVLGITTPNTKTRNRRLHNFELQFTVNGYGIYISKYQTRSKTFPSVLITARSLKELERKAIQHLQSELNKDGRP